MSSSFAPASVTWFVRTFLLLVGALLIGYAASDHPLYGGEPGFGSAQIVISVIGIGVALCALFSADLASRMLLFTVTLLIMLAFTEFAGEIVLGARYRPIYQYDERLIFKFIPNRNSVMTRSPGNGGDTVTHRINSEGYRGDELLPAGKAIRIVVYGDSFIHAYYSPQEETFTAQLGVQLEKQTGSKFEIVNAGVSSYGPDQESLKMEDELPKLRPSLVIVAIFAGNDYGDLMRNKMFRLGTNGGIEINYWKLAPSVFSSFELSQRESIIKRALRNVLGSRRSSDLSKYSSIDFLLGEAEREFQSFVVEQDNTVTNTHIDYYSADISLTPKSEPVRYKVALMKGVMQRIRDVAQRNGTPLVFLFIPHPVDVADHYDTWQINRKRFPDYNGRNLVSPLEDAARSLNVPFVSLYDAFQKVDANSLYFRGGDDHWNGVGQRLAAEIVAGYLLTNKMVSDIQYSVK